ncbi:hypothetical protein [Nocardia bovistercoris]|uniref:Uncharacterized protein n=1 Tax=Nocardia bovistercoris TaxID=2785916 RepID=A0A931ICP9_9NOCA|nr:hypothetical protein [Nocardia bovistercoris]MBH0778994.1 hypothetical protein [Nocardia bovistercoris]
MRIPRALVPLIGAFVLSGTLGVTAVTPVTARAADRDTVAGAPIADAGELCVGAAPTFDDIIGITATALRALVPAEQVAGYDREVEQVRLALSNLRVHRDGLPVHPGAVNERTEFLDDPIVTYLVNGLDAVRTGRIDQTVPASRLTVNDVVEVFILATRLVKIPAQLAAAMVPTVGFVLKPLVGAVFTGVKSLARLVQDNLASRCAAPNAYRPLDLDEVVVAPVAVPDQVRDLANSLVRADGSCTPVADLTTHELVERTRDYLDRSDLPLDRAALRASADSVRAFLAENRVARMALPRRTEELGPLVDALDYGPVTFLTNLGFGIYEGRALETVPLSEVEVENALDLTTLGLDVTSLLITAGTTVAGSTGIAATVTTPISIAQTLLFAPTTYGAPIVKGVIQSMCGA